MDTAVEVVDLTVERGHRTVLAELTCQMRAAASPGCWGRQEQANRR